MGFLPLILTEVYSVDPGSCLREGKPALPSLWPVTDIFQLKYIGLKCSCVLCVLDNSYFLLCSAWLELFRSLAFGLLWYKQRTSGDKWEQVRAVIGTHVFDRIYIFPRPLSEVLWDCNHGCWSPAFSWVKGSRSFGRNRQSNWAIIYGLMSVVVKALHHIHTHIIQGKYIVKTLQIM